MKHVVIVAHPSPQSLVFSLAGAYGAAVAELGGEPLVRDLYRMGLNPLLALEEMPGPDGVHPGEDVVAERRMIADADVFVLVYPLWFYLPPAVLVGYIDRIFGMGFGYDRVRSGGVEPRLAGKKLLSITTSGSPADWVEREGALTALKTLLDHHLAGVCGLEVLDHLHFGDVVAPAPASTIHAHLKTVRARAVDLFGGDRGRGGARP